MADASDLTLAFLRAHAAQAARVLEALPASEAGALLGSIPRGLAAQVFAAMLPTAAARLMNVLDEAAAAGILEAASTHAAVSMLRHIPERKRSRLIAGLPSASALASQMLLGFPDDAVGAWTDPQVDALPPSMLVETALSRLRAAEGGGLDVVYVVDGEHRLLGCAGLRALLRAPQDASLSALMRPVVTTLPVMMPLASARSLPAWERALALPVVEHERRLIGVLHRDALTRAVRARERSPEAHGSFATLGAALASSYWQVVSGLSSATVALLPPAKRVLPEEP
ncbi:MAG: magnesium transporter [Burkholderiales bacterium]|nr:magnesium transporter [Burkholderiales bacterium]